MRLAFVLLALLAAVGRGAAQSAPETSLSTPRVASPDTIGAIHRFYASRRGRGVVIAAAGTTASLGASQIWYKRDSRHGDPFLVPGAYLVLGGVVATVPLILGGILLGDFSPGEEARLIHRYEAGEPLPRRLRRQLKPRYFRP